MISKRTKKDLEMYEIISEMFNSLVEKENKLKQNNFEKLVDLFKTVSDCLQCLMIPYTINVKNENILKEAIKDYKEYVVQFGQLTRFLISFDFWLTKKPIDEKDRKFSLTIDNCIKDVVDFYTSVSEKENTEKVDRLKKSYFAFLMLSRALNNAIINYNKEFPNYKVTELKNIPEPNTLNLDSIDLLQYVKDIELKKVDLFS